MIDLVTMYTLYVHIHMHLYHSHKYCMCDMKGVSQTCMYYHYMNMIILYMRDT